MKLPFYTVLEPALRKNQKTIRTLCSTTLLNVSSVYTGLLGIIGTVLSMFDLIRLLKTGSVWPCSLWKGRVHTAIVNPKCERDLKIIALVVSANNYFFLLLGSTLILTNSALYLPWLALSAIMIVLEFIILVGRVSMEGLSIGRHSLILSMFAVYNWLAVFCDFQSLLGDGCS